MPKEALISKNEIIILFCGAFFAIIWMLIVSPYLQNSVWYQSQVPPIQFLLYEVAFLVGFIAILGFPIQLAYFKFKKKSAIGKFSLILGSAKLGLSGWAVHKLIFDVWESPYFLSPSGEVLLNNNQALTNSAVDAAITWMWQQIGLSGSILYIAVYIVFPLLVLTAIILIFTWKQVLKLFRL